MTIAAFLDLGINFGHLQKELKKIPVKGYALRRHDVQRGHIRAVKFDVIVREPRNYSYRQIVSLFKKSALSNPVKKNILKVYQTLAGAEERAHGHAHADIRFQEVGDIDSIVDIAATCICLDILNVQKIIHSPIPVNYRLAPATSILLETRKMYFTGLLYENITPTGMAILSALAEPADEAQKTFLEFGRCGFGAGAFDPPEVANVLRIGLLERAQEVFESDEIAVLEANIDDMSPQIFDYLFERLYEAGAYEVFLQQVVMKKSRPAFLLTVLSKPEILGKIARLVIGETSTSGVRFYPARRLKAPREEKTAVYRGHKVRMKILHLPEGQKRIIPEYDDCKILAKKIKRPLYEVIEDVKKLS